MTIEDSLRAIVREEMRPVEVKLTLVASLLQSLCQQVDRLAECQTSTTFTSPIDVPRANFTSDAEQASDPPSKIFILAPEGGCGAPGRRVLRRRF